MTNQSTIDKLIEMHMTSMADAFRNQMQDISMKEIPFDDRFGMIVDIEYTSRKNSRLKRLIKNAEFEQLVNDYNRIAFCQKFIIHKRKNIEIHCIF